MLAAENGDTETCHLLLENNANPNLSLQNNEFGKNACWTAAHFAAKESHINVIKLLQTRGANLNIVDERNDTLSTIVQQVITGGIEQYCEEQDIVNSLKATYDAARQFSTEESAASQVMFQIKLYDSRWKTHKQKMIDLRDYLLTQAIDCSPAIKTPLQTCTSRNINSIALITGIVKNEPHVVLTKKADLYGQVYGFLIVPGGIKDKTDVNTEHTVRRK